ncbi:MAG: 7-cyano-7-deazaguanine synthase QueC [Acidobacteriota bacterium]
MKECLVLFSGGIDSTTALFWARSTYDRVTALSFDYGQRHRIELVLGRRLTRRLRLAHFTLKVGLRQIGGSSLTDSSLPLPEFKSADEIGPGIPLTYVPFRNGIFLGLASAWAEVRGIRAIICGFNVIDSPNYPDTRPAFVKAMEKAVNLGTSGSVPGRRIRIIAPFMGLKKSEIIRKGLALGADYSYSISCYCGQEVPCGKCSSCLLRSRAWKEAGVTDHLLQRLKKEGKR